MDPDAKPTEFDGHADHDSEQASSEGSSSPDDRPRRPDPMLVAIAALGGVLAAVNSPAPTDQAIIDPVIVAGSVAAVAWFCSVVPVRFAAALALLAGCASVTWPGLVLGVVCYVGTAGAPSSRMNPRWLSAGILALALNLAARSELDWFFGASSLIGVGIAVVATTWAVATRPKRDRRRLGVIVAVGGLVIALAVAALANAAANSRDDLRTGDDAVQRGLDELIAGDVEMAVASFDEAEAAFARSHDRLSSPTTSLTALVPVVAQHRRAGVELTSEARRAAATLSNELGPIDLEELTFSDGRIDVDAIAALSEPLANVRDDVGDLGSTVADLDNPWLVDPVRDRLDELQIDIAEQLDRSDLFVDVVDHVPTMLGRDATRRYFVAFTTPSEVRGLGGFMGNWAEIEVDDGKIEMTQFGRADDLDEAALPGQRTITGPEDWLDRYGQFGFDNGPGGTVNLQPWKNITLSASMASTGQVIAELYPQSGGSELDGVFVMDVFAVAALLELTGPIALPDGNGTITAESAPRFLLKDQYDGDDNDERVDVLETVSNEVFETLLESELPPPNDILDLLGPLVEQGRISGYAENSDEQMLLVDSGIAGTLVDPERGDGLAITYNNASANKIDFFLYSSADYHVVADQRTGDTTATLQLEMENRSPPGGQPRYVIGNTIDRPPGTNRSLVSIYSRLPLDSARLDGVDVPTEQATEAGYFVTGVVVELPPGGSTTLTLDFSGQLDLADGYELTLRSPPLVNTIRTSVDATLVTDSGERSQQDEFRRAGRHELAVIGPES